MKKPPRNDLDAPDDVSPQQHSEAYLELVLQSTKIGVWRWNVQTGEASIDARWAEIAGYTVDELTSFNIDTLLAMMPAEDAIIVRDKLEAHWRNNESIYKSEYRITHKSGKTIWVEDTGKVVEFDQKGRPVWMVGTHQDITDRKFDEDRLRKLSRIASESINGVVFTDSEGRVEWINQGFERITGYTLAESVGNKPGEMLGGEATDAKVKKEMSQAIRNGEGFHVEIINYHKSGRPYWINIQCSPLLDEQGRAEGFMAIETDITTEKNIAIKLERQQQMLEQMSDLGCIGAWEVDLITSSIYWSSMTKKIHEVPESYQPQLASGIEFYKEGHSRDTIQALVEKAIEDGEPFSTELEIVTAKNNEIWIATKGKTEVVDGVCTRIFGSFQEITDRKKAEAELIEAKEFAEAGKKIKSDLLASMSHEIRTPINGVIGMLNLLSKSELTHHQSRQVGLARSSAQSLLGLINDILDFSKVEAGKLTFEEVNFDLIRMFGEFTQSNAFRCQEKAVELILDTTQVNHRKVCGDPGRLRQILSNLASNATKFTDHGEVRIVCRSERKGDAVFVHVEVHDTGIGIPSEKIPSLFESFTQADTSTTRQYGGTGLGLAIVKNLCELMGGGITATSAVGGGSTFSFTVMLKPDEKGEIIEAHTPVPDDKNALSILVVDDNSSCAAVIQRQLEALGHTVCTALNRETALATLFTHAAEGRVLDFALIDQNMPDMEGLVLASEIYQHDALQRMPVVLMLSLSSAAEKIHRSHNNVSAFIAKPVIYEDLLLLIKHLESQKHARHSDEVIPFVGQKYAVPVCNTEEGKMLWGKETRILLVEDNPVNQEVATGLLQEFGLTYEVAANGMEALAALQMSTHQYPFSLVLMDCFMPEMDGYEATKNIRGGMAGEHVKKIPIIAMTANAMKGDEEKCREAGMDDYITKPVDPEVLLNILKKWLSFNTSAPLHTEEGTQGGQTQIQAQTNTTTAAKDDSQIWDYAAVLRRVNNKPERIDKLIDLFMANMPERMALMEQSLADQNLEQAQYAAHAMKGVSGNLGALALATCVGKLEAHAIAGDHTAAEALAPEVQNAYQRTLEAFREYLERA